jgi:DNA-binding CsgD family transcriptional regulator
VSTSPSQIVPDSDALEVAVRDSRLSVVLFDVDRERIIVVSRPARLQLRLTGTDFETFDLVESASDPDGVRELFAWIRRGTVTEWTWRSRMHSPDGAEYYTDAVIRAIPATPTHPSRCIAFYPSPAMPGSQEEPIVETFGDLTVGSVDADGRIECVRSVAPDLAFAMRRLGTASPPLDGTDVDVELTLESLADDADESGVSGRSSKFTGPHAAQERVVQLERSLLRIAREVESAGFLEGAAVPDASSLPGLDDLSTRQWEVVTRLLRGERVPTIAREMFLSQSTVRNYLWKTYRKVGVRSQVELLEKLQAIPPR